MSGQPGIIAMGTAVPRRSLTQREVGDAVLRAVPDRAGGEHRWVGPFVRRLYRAGGVEHRHTVLGSFPAPGPEGRFIPGAPGEFDGPTTAERNDIYKREISPLAARAALEALQSAGDPQGGRITHIVTASCTGFAAPGFEIELVRTLGLDAAVTRVHLGFMGCYAALPALRVAAALTAAEPRSRVLVVCAELCSLHYRHRFTHDILTANSLFADGAAAAVVGMRDDPYRPFLALTAFRSRLVDGTDDQMTWLIGDHGFTMGLSQKVPRAVGSILPTCFKECCDHARISPTDVAHLAIHPGGRAILDRTAAVLQRDAADLSVSYDILRSYGNMSSATLLFVFERLMNGRRVQGPIFAAAFGPGLCAESALLEAR